MKRNNNSRGNSKNNSDSRQARNIIMAKGTIDNIDDFTETLREAIGLTLGEGYTAELIEFRRGSGERVVGIDIGHMDNNHYPVFYLGELFDDYKAGEQSLSDIVTGIVAVYKYLESGLNTDCADIESFAEVKDYLLPQLIGGDSLETQEYKSLSFGNLKVIFNIITCSIEDGPGTIPVSESLFGKWDISFSELIETAYKNLEKKKMEIRSAREVLGETDFEDVLEEFEKNRFSSVRIANGLFGSAYMTDPVFLDKICKAIGQEEIFILPVIIHEFWVLSGRGSFANPDKVALDYYRNHLLAGIPEEIKLSEDVYKYNRKTKELINMMNGSKIELLLNSRE